MKSAIKFLLLFILTISFLGLVFFRYKTPNAVKGIWEPVSIISKGGGGASTALKSTDGRTNILVLGMDKRSAGNSVASVLTDTIMILSIDKEGKNPVLISIPRDLWVDQTKSKINAIYTLSQLNNPKDPNAEEIAIDKVKSAVENISGIPIHYYALVGFDAFQDSIDAVGGITVNIDETFDDFEYPIEGKENAEPESARYMHVHFDAGVQNLNGEKALQYARSRHSTNPNESGDFARSRRQQKVVVALKEAIISKQTLFDGDKLSALYDSYKKNVKTDISLPEILTSYKKFKDIELGTIQKIVLSNETSDPDKPGAGTLMVPTQEERETRYNGQFVLVPADLTYDAIHALVRSKLFVNPVEEE